MKSERKKIEDGSPEAKIAGTKIARNLDVDPATVRRWVREGCPCYKIGPGLVRYRLSEVIAWRQTRPGRKEREEFATR
jgi:hypothetical protein